MPRARSGFRFTFLIARASLGALRPARERTDRIDLLGTDVVMPNMSGRDLADRLRQERTSAGPGVGGNIGP